MQSGYLSYSPKKNEKQNYQKRKSREPKGQNEIVPAGDGKTKKEQGAPDCNISEKLSCLLFLLLWLEAHEDVATGVDVGTAEWEERTYQVIQRIKKDHDSPWIFCMVRDLSGGTVPGSAVIRGYRIGRMGAPGGNTCIKEGNRERLRAVIPI